MITNILGTSFSETTMRPNPKVQAELATMEADMATQVGLYPIVTSQYSSITLYQVSNPIQ